MDDVARHYGDDLPSAPPLAGRIAARLAAAGKDMAHLTTRDLRAVDEFHIRGHAATLEIAAHLALAPESRVLDIGSGLGGPARALAELHGCHVTGIDLSPAYCAAAAELSDWVGLGDKVAFQAGDATCLPFADASFDAAFTIHVAMNIAAKDRMYAEAHRVLKHGGRFVIYDILQGEGGEVLYPVPWARTSAISHLATAAQMGSLLEAAGFDLLEMVDTTQESADWFSQMPSAPAGPAQQPNLALLLGPDFPQMMRNQIRNLKERRIAVVRLVCVCAG